jgi:hypothetical protein
LLNKTDEEKDQRFAVTKLLFERNFCLSEADGFVQNLLCHDFPSVETTSPTVAYCLLKAVVRQGIYEINRQRGRYGS